MSVRTYKVKVAAGGMNNLFVTGDFFCIKKPKNYLFKIVAGQSDYEIEAGQRVKTPEIFRELRIYNLGVSDLVIDIIVGAGEFVDSAVSGGVEIVGAASFQHGFFTALEDAPIELGTVGRNQILITVDASATSPIYIRSTPFTVVGGVVTNPLDGYKINIGDSFSLEASGVIYCHGVLSSGVIVELF